MLDIEVKDLSVAFEHETVLLKALDKVSFTLASGEILALLGESGCGKSVMAASLMRLLPQYARYGAKSAIYLGDTDSLLLPEYLMRSLRGKRLGMIFQEPMVALNPVLTIRAQLAEAFLREQRLSGKALEAQLVQALEEVEIHDPLIKLSQYPHQLSGGQRQRVMIAMALASRPEVLIADEPTTALDVTIQAQILKLIKCLQKQRKMSVLLITHDMGVVRAVADRVCVMYAGEVVELAKVNDFFNDVLHPYVQQLLASVPTLEKRKDTLQTLSGNVPSLGHFPAGCRFHPRCIYAFDKCRVEKPALLSCRTSLVRCHLYPRSEPLPPLPHVEVKIPIERKHKKSEVILEAKAISIQFQVKSGFMRKAYLDAVNHISLKVKSGKTLAIVGESGSGKTTLGRALLGLYPLSSGEICYHQMPTLQMGKQEWKRYRQKVQMVFQDPYTSLDPRMRVGEILAEGMRVQGMKAHEIARKQRQLLEQVYLPLSSLDRYPHAFSGGQRQRISIARALATNPELLVCDEPTSALDVSVQAQILNLFKELQARYGLAYVFITHNMGVVAHLADEVMVMQEGQMVEFGETNQILTAPKEAYTKQLLASVLS